ncbi:hypothetical protein PVK06_029826 [Gossypium arboreum]|uniref:Transposase MuDR plant domain-containing protein n=1 Tax=Gossypium arboreum TaxID=29729 RepID=A0ABR0NMS4_GOSAR|nr:hypothetical protein PVK06_029826 [Gossypium arboreum]
MEKNEDLTVYGEEHGAQESCVVAPISYIDSESTIRGISIDLNVTPDIDVVDDVSNDIDDEDVIDNGNINTSSIGNQMRRIVIHNNPRPHMSLIDPDVVHAAEFSEYPEILPDYQLIVNSNLEELFVGQRFESKEEYVFSIKRYNMNISVDYKVAGSKLTLYIEECWKSAEGCNWRVRAAFIQNSKM